MAYSILMIHSCTTQLEKSTVYSMCTEEGVTCLQLRAEAHGMNAENKIAIFQNEHSG